MKNQMKRLLGLLLALAMVLSLMPEMSRKVYAYENKYITSIEKGAFKNAKNLKDITFKSGKIKEIGNNAFKGIDKNVVITIFAGKKAYANLIELIKGAGVPKSVEFNKGE